VHFVATSVGGIGLTFVGLLPPMEVAVQVLRCGRGVGGVCRSTVGCGCVWV